MSRIKGKDTGPELLIRKAIFARGFRYRLHVSSLPGRPDLVFPRYNAVIFINGCFWHYHRCRLSKIPATRPDWWEKKLTGNRNRDQRNVGKLLGSGWRVLTIWECAFRGTGRDRARLKTIVNNTERWLRSNSRQRQIPPS